MNQIIKLFSKKPIQVDVPPYSENKKIIAYLNETEKDYFVKVNIINRNEVNYLTDSQVKHYLKNYIDNIFKLCLIDEDIKYSWEFNEL